ncbi:c-type cytochrome [Sideroxydans sp.]
MRSTLSLSAWLMAGLMAMHGSSALAGDAGKAAAPFTPPSEESMPSGPMGDAIRYGHQLTTQTQVYAKKYVGNELNCTSCHLNGGRTPNAAPWVGIWGVFPEYRTRNAQVNTLQDRVNDCFQRSMNGKPLPVDSKEMNGILAYMWWLSKDVPTGVDVAGRGFKRIKAERAPDTAKGKAIYAEKCSACHGADGQGMKGPEGEYMFPALWGPKSFNIAAGMARLNTAAAFVKANMPLGQGGSLTDQEAYDVAAYFTQQPRPDYAAKKKDWPNGDKPKDARY